MAKIMKMDHRKRSIVKDKCEEIWVTNRLGNKKLVGYCNPIPKSYVIGRADYEAYTEWRDSQG